jgi:hypothetical protein
MDHGVKGLIRSAVKIELFAQRMRVISDIKLLEFFHLAFSQGLPTIGKIAQGVFNLSVIGHGNKIFINGFDIILDELGFIITDTGDFLFGIPHRLAHHEVVLQRGHAKNVDRGQHDHNKGKFFGNFLAL